MIFKVKYLDSVLLETSLKYLSETVCKPATTSIPQWGFYNEIEDQQVGESTSQRTCIDLVMDFYGWNM